jgi:hypothetical protein
MSFDRVARLSVMLAPRHGGTRAELSRSLVLRRDRFLTLFGPKTHVRIGTRCERDPLGQSMGEARAAATVEAAVEITGGEGTSQELASHAKEFGVLLRPLIDVTQAALTVGPTHRIVEPKRGGVFLSLSFKRHPDTTVQQFRHWWLTQHAEVAVPRLPGLLGYDQVHVDHDLSRRASEAAGLPYVPFDSYDNLTWASVEAFTQSTSDPTAMRTIYEDELGHIDHSTYRGALMDDLSCKPLP